MNSFLKIFLATLAALFVFSILSFFMLFGFLTGLAVPEKTKTDANAVLVVDLAQPYPEIEKKNILAALGTEDEYDLPSLHNVVRLIRKATNDSAVKGIYIKCDYNANGFAASNEIRNALLDFRTSKKFIYAYADVIPQDAYQVANVADKVYCHPKGGVDWRGFGLTMAFIKGTLDKLDIQPQIFYAGKFKSATEPFREKKMTDANRIQTKELLDDLYVHFLLQTSQMRNIDTGQLRAFADNESIRFPEDALRNKLVDGLKYDDEVKEEIRATLKVNRLDRINFVPLGKYAKSVSFKESGKGQIALIYAAGDIVPGKGSKDQIGSEEYQNLIRRARLDEKVDAIVLRINSGGGSSLASENIWRELTLARKDKPVVVSFGDVAASGAYYLACNADSIFAQPNTITGSIGVFALVPNMEKFFNNKLGVTFDDVATGPNAGGLSVVKPLTETQRRFIQHQIDTIYHDFKSRVAEGRKKSMTYVDSIAQGRVWSGTRALELGLIDRIGGLKEAVASAANMSKLSTYSIKEYPGERGLLEELFGNYRDNSKTKMIERELGEEGMKSFTILRRVKEMIGVTQARLPFDFSFD
jgi:protease-4